MNSIQKLEDEQRLAENKNGDPLDDSQIEREIRNVVLEFSSEVNTLGELFERLGLTNEEAIEIQQKFGLSGKVWLDVLTFGLRDSIIQMVFMYTLMIIVAISSVAITNALIVEKGCTPPEFLASSLGVFALLSAVSLGGFLAFNVVPELIKRKKIGKHT